MQIEAVPGHGISHYNVNGITCAEMETLCTLESRADDVCASMEDKEKKTEYFTKEECNLIRAVLHKFTEVCVVNRFNSFLEFLEEEKKEKENPQTPHTEMSPEVERHCAVFKKGENFFYADRSYIPCSEMVETMIYPCDKKGNITDWTEVYCDRSEMSLEDCIKEFLAE